MYLMMDSPSPNNNNQGGDNTPNIGNTSSIRTDTANYQCTAPTSTTACVNEQQSIHQHLSPFQHSKHSNILLPKSGVKVSVGTAGRKRRKFGVPIQLPTQAFGSSSAAASSVALKMNDSPTVVAVGGTESSPICLSDDDENDNNTRSSLPNIQQPLTNMMKKLTRHCWVCAEPLRTSTPTTIDINYDKHPVYLMHVHPVLRCPICQYCSEIVHNVEQRQQHVKDGNQHSEEDAASIEESSTYCIGCGQDDNSLPDGTTLFMCDNNIISNLSTENYIKNNGQEVSHQKSCTHIFCQHCVAQAYGGGNVGIAKVKQLCQEGDEVKWNCLVCDAPYQLQLLHQALTANTMNHEVLHESTNDSMVLPRRSLDSLLWDLAVAEEDWEKYNDELTKLDAVVTQEFEDNENDEIEQVALRRHLVNLEGFISSLQEEAELEHNKSIASLYKNGLNIAPMMVDQNDKPEYVKAAEKALATQDSLERAKSRLDIVGKNPNLYQRDDYFVDAEDLCNDNAETLDTEYRYAVSLHGATEEEIEYAYQSENRRISRMMLPMPKPINEMADEEEDKQYELEVSGRQLSSEHGSQTFGRDEYSVQTRLSCLEMSSILKITLPQSRKHYRSKKFNDDDTDNSSSSSSGMSSTKQNKRIATVNRSILVNSAMVSDYNLSIPKVLPLTKKKLPTLLSETNFQNSNVVLSYHKRIPISIDARLSCNLKKHQIDGIHFMWGNSCADILLSLDNQDSSKNNSIETNVGGCVLAHYMGLGKSLSVIALLHTVMKHPQLWNQQQKQQAIQSVLLVAPVNTIDNWKTEFDKWLGPFDPLPIYNLQFSKLSTRLKSVKRWEKRGGILLTSQFILRELLEKHATKQGVDTFLQPNLLVVDEAHMMLKNNGTQIFKALSLIKTKRKIVLTGSPFQNNLLEYYNMIDFVRPGVLGPKALFDQKYGIPIGKGMASDASPRVYYASLVQSKELAEVVRPYVDRKTSVVLQNDLPPLVDVALYVRQTVLQRDLYQLYARYKRKKGGFKFITQHAALFPVHNHPGCLQIRSENNSAKFITKDCNTNANDDQWWAEAFASKSREKVLALNQGFKMVILMHILALAQTRNEKVLVFSNCKDTLNYIEYALGLQNWKDHLPSLRKYFLGIQLGSWRKEIDYYRIDGGVSAEDRGRFVKQFNQNNSQAKAFLLSCEAGGVGINLQSASRVVLMDNHFNPAVMKQSVCRAHRLGQEKPVYCYRLLTEKTMEEKVFNRCVNKTALGLRVIDEQNIERCFTSSELSNLAEIPLWVECIKCQKKRLLPSHNSDNDIPNNWSCDMNVDDPINSTCSASEKDDRWYENLQIGYVNESDTSLKSSSTLPIANSNDFLDHLLGLSSYGPIISKHVFHEKLLQALDEALELEQARKACLDLGSINFEELEAENLMKSTLDLSSNTHHLPGDRNMIEKSASIANGETNQPGISPIECYREQAYDSLPSLKALAGKAVATRSNCTTTSIPASDVVVKGENMSSTALSSNENNSLPPILHNPHPFHFGRNIKRSSMKSTLWRGQMFDMTEEPDKQI